MGIAYALLAMLCFATNIVITRYAVARLPVESGFFVVLATNVLFPAALFATELGVRTAPYAWHWKGAGLFAIGGVIGTFLGRRFLFDTVKLLGPSRASVFHSTAPAFALIGAWLLAGEVLGAYEIADGGGVVGLWFRSREQVRCSNAPGRCRGFSRDCSRRWLRLRKRGARLAMREWAGRPRR